MSWTAKLRDIIIFSLVSVIPTFVVGGFYMDVPGISLYQILSNVFWVHL